MSIHRKTRPLHITMALVLVTTLLAGCHPGSSTSAATARAANGPATSGRTAARIIPVGSTAPVDAGAWALADRLRAPVFSADTTSALVGGLARSGIGTFADTTATSPDQPVAGLASPFRLLDFQVHALAVGVWAGAGYSGAEMDMLVPLPAGLVGSPTTSQLLAGYVAATDSPGGALSRALMAGQNLLAPASLRFPALVLTLFASDLATDAGRLGAPSAGPPSSGGVGDRMAVASGSVHARTTVADLVDGGICSRTANWINGMIDSVFNYLKFNTPTNVFTMFSNWVVGKAQAGFHGLITVLTGSILGTVRSIAEMVSATAVQIASLLPYAVKVLASGASGATFTLGSQPLAGTFTASISAGNIPDWPAVLSDCADTAGITIPDFHSKGIPLTWGPIQAPGDPMLTPTDSTRNDQVTDANGQSTWVFQTSTDPGDEAGEQRNQFDDMPVTVHRPELDDVRARLTRSLLGRLPGFIRPFVAGRFDPYIDGLQARVNTLLDARGVGTAILVYHGAKPPTAPATPSGSCGHATAGTYTGTFSNHSVETIVIVNGGKVVDHNDGTGPATLIVAADGSITGTWSERMHEVFNEHINITDFEYHRVVTWALNGTFIGTVCKLGIANGQLRRLSCVVNQGTCGSAEQPPTSENVPLGGPKSSTPGHLTWEFTYHGDAGANVSDVLTISVSQ